MRWHLLAPTPVSGLVSEWVDNFSGFGDSYRIHRACELVCCCCNFGIDGAKPLFFSNTSHSIFSAPVPKTVIISMNPFFQCNITTSSLYSCGEKMMGKRSLLDVCKVFLLISKVLQSWRKVFLRLNSKICKSFAVCKGTVLHSKTSVLLL